MKMMYFTAEKQMWFNFSRIMRQMQSSTINKNLKVRQRGISSIIFELFFLLQK